jgi:hypothetical protein
MRRSASRAASARSAGLAADADGLRIVTLRATRWRGRIARLRRRLLAAAAAFAAEADALPRRLRAAGGVFPRVVYPRGDQPRAPFDALAAQLGATPGFGLDVYSRFRPTHQPMAYALFASAMLERSARTRDPEPIERAEAAIRWLIDHPTSPNGWGLGIAFAPFRKAQPNPPATAYAITTALVVQALYDFVDAREASPREASPRRVCAVAERARVEADHALQRLSAFVSSDATGAWPWYSERADDDVATFNVTAMVAGQLQRSGEPSLARIATAMMQHLHHHAQRSADGLPRWPYALHPLTERPNDLVHHAYIVDGIAAYLRYGGAPLFDPAALHASLAVFLRGGCLREFPEGDAPARVWASGAALHAAATLERHFAQRGLVERLAPHTRMTGPFYPRVATHVLWGLAALPPAADAG